MDVTIVVGVSMQPSSERPPFVDLLMSEVGELLGLEGFGFDPEHECQLTWADDLITLRLDEARQAVLVSHVLIDEVLYKAAEPLTVIMAANARSAWRGMGIAVLDPETMQLVWMDKIVLRGLNAFAFLEALDRARQSLVFWRETVLAQLSGSAATPSEKPAATGGPDAMMIRI